MQDIRPRGVHYSVKLYNPYASTPCIDVQRLANVLPHGSGIDGDWTIEVLKNGNLILTGDYHKMSDFATADGLYDGWLDFRLRIYRANKDKLHPLTGPCEGKVQVTEQAGSVYMTDVRGAGEHNDYLSELMDYELTEAKLVAPLGMEIRDAKDNE